MKVQKKIWFEWINFELAEKVDVCRRDSYDELFEGIVEFSTRATHQFHFRRTIPNSFAFNTDFRHIYCENNFLKWLCS